MTPDDWCTVARRDDEVVLVLSTHAAVVIKSIVERLQRSKPTDRIWRRAFPDAYLVKADTREFRDRYEPGMRAEVMHAAGRVLAGWSEDGTFLLTSEQLDDWLLTLLNARWLYVDRSNCEVDERAARGERDMVAVAWLQFLHDELITAALPELGSGEPA